MHRYAGARHCRQRSCGNGVLWFVGLVYVAFVAATAVVSYV